MAARLLLLFLLLIQTLVVAAQGGGVRGRVTDAATKEALPGVSVLIAGTTTGTSSGNDGEFTITGLKPGTYKVMLSSIGYEALPGRTVEIGTDVVDLGTIGLAQASVMAGEVVVSASRRPEKLTEAPVTIDLITAKQIDELPSFNVGELLARQKGVDYIRSGVLGAGINVRGFNSAFNPKNLQMNDARLSTLIATGLPLGPLTSVVKEDIERVEIILGPSAALYGPNAHNGLVNTISKDPRRTAGTTVALGVGNQSVFSGRFRHAQVLNSKLAFKVTGEYTRGEDFAYNDTVYYTNSAFKTAATPTTPASPGIFHAEKELDLDRTFKSLHGEAAVYYSLPTRPISSCRTAATSRAFWARPTPAAIRLRTGACSTCTPATCRRAGLRRCTTPGARRPTPTPSTSAPRTT